MVRVMRRELYEMICKRLSMLYFDGQAYELYEEGDVPEGWERAIRHIDLWNHNVEYIEQEEQWERPAVFVEFEPIRWNVLVGRVEYRAKPMVSLHVVTDWQGSSAASSEMRGKSLEVFDLLEAIHNVLCGMKGDTFVGFDLVESVTNHNHDEIIENVERYECVGFKRLL